MNKLLMLQLAALLLIFPKAALAYIGPGLGVGVLAAVLGVFIAILMLLVGLIWYPIKRLIRRLRSKQ